MGMSASQARLLSLTSRLHDVEFKAQGVQAQKIALATRKDQVYKNYTNALDATKYEVMIMDPKSGYTDYIEADYKTCCTYNDNMVRQYALRDNQTNKIMVSNEVAEAYDLYGNDKYAFAYAMMGFTDTFSPNSYLGAQGCEIGIGEAQDDYGYYSNTGTGYDLYMTDVEQSVFDKHAADGELQSMYDDMIAIEDDGERKKALDNFRELLYSKYGSEIFEATQDIRISTDSSYTGKNDTFSDVKREIAYYVTLWEAIDEAGGYTTIDEKHISGDDSDEWFKNMVEAGLVTIMAFDENGASDEWSETSVATSLGMNYLQEVEDEELIKKAEIEYEYQLDLINQKDAEYDNELNQLETERSAIKTEIESINTVIDENQERTFDLFN